MEVPYRNKKTGAVSPGLRCMKPHMKNHPWCRQANSEEGPSITGSKFQREGSNYDAWAISEIGKFEGNVAHSMSSGVWISGCAKNVAIFEGTGEYLMQTQKQCSCNCRYSFIFFLVHCCSSIVFSTIIPFKQTQTVLLTSLNYSLSL